jgi:hypothetical protein
MTLQQRTNAAPTTSAANVQRLSAATSNARPATRQVDLRCIRAAQVALGWAVVFVAFHVYWDLGGSFVSPGNLSGGISEHPVLRGIVDVLYGSMFVLGFLVPLAISRGWARGRLAQPVAILAWSGGAILTLRGATGLIDDLTRVTGVLPNGLSGISTESATGTASGTGSYWAIETYFLIGGLIFTWLAIRYREHRHRRARPTIQAQRTLRRDEGCSSTTYC